VTNHSELVGLVAEKARSGVSLTVFGFGMGNLKDDTLELLARSGNGSYGYVDSSREARKLLVEQVEGTLATIAQDVKIQVEFNPAQVASYRLIGYENRRLERQDFADDTVDAGEMGAGHTVTALYEVVPAPAPAERPPASEPLRYQLPPLPLPRVDPSVLRELLTVRIRYKEPQTETGRQVEFPFTDEGGIFADASGDFKFAAAVAGFGLILRDSPHKGQATFEQVLSWAEAGLGDDKEGHRAEFVELVKQARDLSGG
jgi:Ca-activated chloride channel family protein